MEEYGPRASVVLFKGNNKSVYYGNACIPVLVVHYDTQQQQMLDGLSFEYRRRNLEVPRVYCMNPPPMDPVDLFIINDTHGYEPLLALCANVDLVKIMVAETSVRVVMDPDEENLKILCSGDGCFKLVVDGQTLCEACQ